MLSYEIIGELDVSATEPALLKVHGCTKEPTVTILYGDVSVSPLGDNQFALTANSAEPASIDVSC